jgi:hypothetical protein
MKRMGTEAFDEEEISRGEVGDGKTGKPTGTANVVRVLVAY